MKLYIIGNGFDLNHGMKTNFENFRVFINNKQSKSIGELERLCIQDVWNDFEFSLGAIDFEMFMAEMGSVYDREDNDNYDEDSMYSDQFDFEHYLPNYTDLQEDLIEWLSNVDLPIKKYKLDRESMFLTFNYTNVLEKVYEVDNNRIIHIHGSLGSDENLQVGFGNINTDNILDEADCGIYTKDFPYELIGYEMIVNYLNNFEKNIARNIEKYPNLFKKRLCFNEIYILGFSFNQIDITYLKLIFDNIDSETKINISYYNDKDKKKINNFIKNIKFENVKIDIMENILEKI